MSLKPSVIFLPGSFTPADLYFPIRDAVTARGIDAHVLPLPTVRLGPHDKRPAPSMYDDAAAISSKVERLADEGKDVIVISSSYSGVPMTQSCKGLSKTERQNDGKKGGLVMLAYMPSTVPAIGQAATDILFDVSLGNQMPMDLVDDEWLSNTDHSVGANLVFSQLPAEKRLPLAQRSAQHSLVCFSDKTTFTGYTAPGVELAYLFCEKDLLVSPKNQQYGIDMMEKASGKKVAVTKVPGDHAPVFSVKDHVIEWVIGLTESQPY